MPILQPHHPAAQVPHRDHGCGQTILVVLVAAFLTVPIAMLLPDNGPWGWVEDLVALVIFVATFIANQWLQARRPATPELELELAQQRLEAALRRYSDRTSVHPVARIDASPGDEMADKVFNGKSTFGPQLIHWLNDEELDWLISQHQAHTRRGHDFRLISGYLLVFALLIAMFVGAANKSILLLGGGIPLVCGLLLALYIAHRRHTFAADAEAAEQTGNREAAIRALYKMQAQSGAAGVSTEVPPREFNRARIERLRRGVKPPNASAD